MCSARALRAKLVVLLLVAAGASACAAQTTVAMESGQVVGAVVDGVISWKGIPYAAPPVGQLRWRNPQPPQPWKDVRDASSFGADCLQTGRAHSPNISEDCLYLNVWRPEKASAKLPVMVWIYGGAFVTGAASLPQMNGASFAREGVILVSFNYRLGRFGFFAHPALTAEGKDPVLANYGFTDQLAALKWVQRNIGAFGGDPSHVTVFGESAGAMGVLALLASPMTHGLFSQAIVESGGGRQWHELGRTRDLAQAEQTGVAFAKTMNISGTDATALQSLRSLPAEKVLGDLTLITLVKDADTFCGPVVDGKFTIGLPDDVFATGGGLKVPLMIGATDADMGVQEVIATTPDQVWARFGKHQDEAKTAYAAVDGSLPSLKKAVGADQMMVEPARWAARQYAAKGVPVYEYRFSYVPEALRPFRDGARHATDVVFVFNTLPPNPQISEADRAMAATIHKYFAAFGRTGNPNGEGRPEWPKYNPGQDVLMNFTNDGPKTMPDPEQQRLDLVEKVATGK